MLAQAALERPPDLRKFLVEALKELKGKAPGALAKKVGARGVLGSAAAFAGGFAKLGGSQPSGPLAFSPFKYF